MMMDEALDKLFEVKPISKGIHQSIDDLRLGGCCQCVADLPALYLGLSDDAAGGSPGPTMAASRIFLVMVLMSIYGISIAAPKTGSGN